VTTPDAQLALAPFFGTTEQALVRHTPYSRALGLRLVELGPRTATLALPHRADLIGDPVRGVIFGGVITGLLDQASGLSIACSLDVPRAIATIDFRIDYLRAAAPGAELFGRAECYRLTRNVAFVRSTAWDADPDDPFASALATFMIGANTAESPYARLLRERLARKDA
jgi:uncharacterized protein (TIGR00369 family)